MGTIIWLFQSWYQLRDFDLAIPPIPLAYQGLWIPSLLIVAWRSGYLARRYSQTNISSLASTPKPPTQEHPPHTPPSAPLAPSTLGLSLSKSSTLGIIRLDIYLEMHSLRTKLLNPSLSLDRLVTRRRPAPEAAHHVVVRHPDVRTIRHNAIRPQRDLTAGVSQARARVLGSLFHCSARLARDRANGERPAVCVCRVSILPSTSVADDSGRHPRFNLDNR